MKFNVPNHLKPGDAERWKEEVEHGNDLIIPKENELDKMPDPIAVKRVTPVEGDTNASKLQQNEEV